MYMRDRKVNQPSSGGESKQSLSNSSFTVPVAAATAATMQQKLNNRSILTGTGARFARLVEDTTTHTACPSTIFKSLLQNGANTRFVAIELLT